MRRHPVLPLLAVGFCLILPVFPQAMPAEIIPAPVAFFGFQPGSDGNLVDYEQLVAYLQKVAETSPRIKVMEVGRSPMDKPMMLAFISSEENIRNLDSLKEINRRLALDPTLPAAELDRLADTGKVFLMVTLSMHSEEVGPSQMLPLYAYELAAAQDEATRRLLDDVVLMVIPNHNPDGMDMVVQYYRKQKGTKFEGSSLPGIYHKYVGHDNNRDFLALTQSDTRAINRLFSTEWYPQVLLEKHQMGDTGPRFYVPPNHDPIAENIDEGLWNWIATFGSGMSRDMGAAGQTGVVSHWEFDDYWPGCTETSLWKNVISFLTENASCKVARPVWVEPGELEAHGKGLAEYKKSVNMPAPWPGGWWRLSDIVAYEQTSLRSVHRTASTYRREILRFRNELCRKEVAKGLAQPPFDYVLPLDQPERGELARLVNLLREHGVRVYQLSRDIPAGRQTFARGDIVIPLAQPYRAFIKEVMEAQKFPVRHFTPDGEIMHPYDITSWSFPLHRGLQSVELNEPVSGLSDALTEITADFAWPRPDPAGVASAWALAYPAGDNESFHAVFLALAAGLPVERLERAMVLPDFTLPAGSFLIRAEGDAKSRLAKLAAEVNTPPRLLDQPVTAPTRRLAPRRVALVETFAHDMDAGWTRYIFDTYGIPFTVVHPGDFEKTDFQKDFDVLVFPGADKNLLLSGQFKAEDRYWQMDYPPEFQKGIGAKGMERVTEFLEQGGIVLSWGASTELFTDPLERRIGKDEVEKYQLPVRNVGKELVKKGLDVPGSWLRLTVRNDLPLGAGLPAETGAFCRERTVMETSVPDLDMDRRVIAAFPEEKILVSGFARREELLAQHPAMVWVRKGKGQLVLYSFHPQFRASTPATYKLLFNALLLPPVPETK